MRVPPRWPRNVFLMLGVMLAPAGAALAGNAKLGFSAPNNTTTKRVTVKITYPNDPNKPYIMTADIDPNCDAMRKRNLIAAAVDAHGHPNWRVDKDPNEAQMTIRDLPKDAVVEFDANGTGEANDKITVAHLMVSAAGYSGVFDPLDPQGLPAVFTAGIVTDVGELSVEVSSEELSFQTDGAIICQALFQRLAPGAPQYGAQINYAGDRLEVYFDPAYTLAQGGIVFGTTSPSPGSYASVLMPDGDCNDNGIPDSIEVLEGFAPDCNQNLIPDDCDVANGTSADADGNGVPDECEPLPSGCKGDSNCDGRITWRDIDYFVAAQNDNVSAWTAKFGANPPACPFSNNDVNDDGHATWRDINGFVGLQNTTCLLR